MMIIFTTQQMIKIGVAREHIIAVLEAGTGARIKTAAEDIAVRESFDQVLALYSGAISDDKHDTRDDSTAARGKTGNKR